MSARSVIAGSCAVAAGVLLARCGGTSGEMDASSALDATAADVFVHMGETAPYPHSDAAEPGSDVATAGPDAALAGLDAATPGLDAATFGADVPQWYGGETAPYPWPDAAEAGPDAAAPGPDASQGSDAGACCVVFNLCDGGVQQFCQGPALTGPSAPGPTIGVVAGMPGTVMIELHSGLSRSKNMANSLYVTLYRGQDAGAFAPGTYQTPQIDYYDSTGGWWENNASNGSLTVDSWPAVGGTTTGAFEGGVAQMSGPGAFCMIHGTFCAVRAADR